MIQTRLSPQPPFTALHGPVIIAHRGGSLEAPENTIASVRHGITCGADWQEIDVLLSNDDVVMVFHDDILHRTTRGAGQGLARLKSQKQLQQLHVGRPMWADYVLEEFESYQITAPDFLDRFSHETIPTLEQILTLPNARIMIELKTTPTPARLAGKVLDVVHKTRMHEQVALGSFDFATLEAVYQRDPSVALIGIVDDENSMKTLLQLPLRVLAVSRTMAESAKSQLPPGVALWVWTAYTTSQAQELYELGVNGIITDAPTPVLQALRPNQRHD